MMMMMMMMISTTFDVGRLFLSAFRHSVLEALSLRSV